MSHQFAPKAVFRQLPLDLIRSYLSQDQIAVGDDWTALAENDVPALCRAWMALPPRDCQRVEQMLRDVHELASEAGVRVLIAEAAHRGRDIADDLAEIPGHHAKALWALLNHPPAFHTARQLLSASAPAGRYWHRTPGFDGRPYNASRAAVQELRLALARLYREQGRGQRCTVEDYDRPACLYLFVYLDDYTTTHTAHNELGKLVRAAVRPAFEVVYAYRRAAGVLDMYARGERRWRDALRDAFCTHVLGCLTPPAPLDQQYRLNHLLGTRAPLPADPARGVTAASVRLVRVIDRRERERRVDLTGVPWRAGDVNTMLGNHFPAALFPPEDLYIGMAEFRVSYHPPGGGDRSFSFQVTYPDGCNLRSLPEDQRAIGERCLRLWGIIPDDPAGEGEPADAG